MSPTILTLINFVAILLFWNIFWRKFQICRFRDKMFEIRGRLFDVAINNPELSFQSELYARFESMLNGSARFAYRIGFIDYLYFSVFLRPRYKQLKSTKEFEEFFGDAISRISNENTRQVLLKIKKDYEFAVVDLLTFSSLVLSTLFCSVVAGFVARGLVRLVMKLGTGILVNVDSKLLPARISAYSKEISSAIVEIPGAKGIIIETQMEAELAQSVA